VQEVWAPLAGRWLLQLRLLGRSVLLCLSVEQGVQRVSVAQERPKEASPTGVQGALRKGLIGAQLQSVSAHPSALEVKLSFAQRGVPRVLVGEFFAGGGLFLLNEAGRVLATSSDSPLRQRVGQIYASAAPQLSPAELALPSRLASLEGDVPLARAAEAMLAPMAQAREVEGLRRAVLSRVQGELKRTVRALEKVREDIKRAEGAASHRRMGEILSRNLHLVPKGATSVRLTDYTDQGEVEVEVTLSPARTPKQQSDWHFHQYRRFQRGESIAKAREAMLTQKVAALQKKKEGLSALSEEELSEQLPQGRPAKKGSVGPALPYKEYVAASGQRIWVGKDARGNDALTFHIARPHHLWLHARGVPGSHVVVPLEKNAQLSEEVLLDASHLAVHHSRAKEEPLAEVSYVEVKLVRRQKGGAPGQVVYSQEKTFRVRLEPERIRRLLESREEG
jgi:predicted ribosome quality control (RQC) complex YloA/Tae2 family protein